MVKSVTDSVPVPSRPIPSGAFALPPARAKTPPPCIPLQEDFYKRTTSFKNWPKGTGVKVSDLVNSGFTYLGVGDQVQCFHCGEIINNWRETDVVDREHIKLSPDCAFIKKKLGCDNDVSTMTEHQPREHRVTVTAPKYIQPSEPLTAPSLPYSHCVDASMQAARKNLHPVAPRDIRARLDTAPSRKLIEMGFKKPLLAQVIGERLAEIGDDFSSFMEYFIAVKNAEQILSGGQVDTLKNFYDNKVERMSNPASVYKTETEQPQIEPVPGQTNTGAEAAAGNGGSDSSLKRKKECNICMDAEADTVFMPCRHMCACSECGDKLTTCPICRKGIEHCIKVFV